MAEPQDMILVLLREMRHDTAEFRQEMVSRFEHLEAKIEDAGTGLDSVRQMPTGESVLGRYAAAEVEERLEMRRLAALEAGG